VRPKGAIRQGNKAGHAHGEGVGMKRIKARIESDCDNNTDDDDLRGAKEAKQGEALRPGERTIPKCGKKG
jgi:hypothetical protein